MANIELDGANKKITVDSGDLTLDIPGDIILDGDGGDLTFADGGTNLLKVTNSSSDVVLQPQVDAKDIIFKQYDGRNLLEINDGGYVAIANGATGPGQLRLYEDTDNGTNYSAFQVGTQSGDITYTLPTADGSNGQQLTTNGSGVLSWAASGGLAVGDITGATALAVTPADTDEFVFSDNGTLKRIDYAHMRSTFGNVSWMARMTSDLSLNDATTTTVVFDTEILDTDSAYNASTGIFTAPVAGKYLVGIQVAFGDAEGNISDLKAYLSINDGAASNLRAESTSNGALFTLFTMGWTGITTALSANDTIRVKVNADTNDSSSSYLEGSDYHSVFWGCLLLD